MHFVFLWYQEVLKGLQKLEAQKLGVVSLSLGRQQNSMHSIFIGNGIKIANDILVMVREVVMVSFGC